MELVSLELDVALIPQTGQEYDFDALFLEAIYRFFGAAKDTPFPSGYVRLFSESLTLNCDAAERDLGYRPKVTLRQAMTIMNGMRRRI